MAALVQLALLTAALTVGILQPERPTEPSFHSVPVNPAVNQAQAQVQQMQQFQQSSTASAQIQRISSNALLSAVLPKVEISSMDFSQPALMTGWDSFSPIGMAQDAGIWDANVSSGGSSVSMFGLQTEATRVLIAFDISGSVKTKVERAGLSMERVRDQTWENLESMNANTLFGMIQFARAAETFDDQLRPATRRHLERAHQWLHRSFRTDGSSGNNWQRGKPDGIEDILRRAFAMDRSLDTLIIISDGDFYRTTARGGGERVPWPRIVELTRELQSTLEVPCSIHLIAFDLPANNRSWALEWTRQNNGRLIEIRN